MAGNHVGEQTDGQGGRADDQQLKQVDRSQQEIDRPRHTGGEQLVAQIVAEALRADGGDPVLDQCPDSEHERHDHRGVGRHVHTWNDAAQVENEDREEQGGDHRHVALATGLTHHVIHDLVAHEVETVLDYALPTAGDELGALCGHAEHHQQHDGCHDTNQNNAVDGKRSSLEQNLRGKEVINRGQMSACLVSQQQSCAERTDHITPPASSMSGVSLNPPGRQM